MHEHTDAVIGKGPAPGTLSEVARGVHAWIQPDGTWWINNAGVVLGEERALLVDTCTTERRTRQLLAAVDGVRGEVPLTHAVNTHHHGDHTYGNSLLAPAVSIVGHTRMRAGLLLDTTLGSFPPFWAPRPDFGDLSLRAPDITFDSRLTVHLGDRDVELVHPGYTAHTDGDVGVWVPDVKVLFVGDLLFPGHTPMIMAGAPSGAIRSLDWMASFEADQIVPGHGPVLRGTEIAAVLADHERYYRFVMSEARRGVEAGLSPLEVARVADLGEFSDLLDPERFVLNVHSAYGELTGTPVSRPAALADCVAWLGAPIHTKV